MRQTLERIALGAARPAVGVPTPPDPEMLERLEGLGYAR